MELELKPLNILIGSNASGKSNVLQIFAFLRDIINHGLENAVSIQGGSEYLRNISIGASKDLILETTIDNIHIDNIHIDNIHQNINRMINQDVIQETEYVEILNRLSIGFNKRGPKYKVINDELDIKFLIGKRKLSDDTIIEEPKKGRLKIFIKEDEYEVDLMEGTDDLEFPDLLLINLKSEKPSSTLLQNTIINILLFPEFLKSLKLLSIYDIDPKLSKRSVPISGMVDLEENASNLALALNKIIEDKEKRRKFENLLTYVLPFAKSAGVEKFADKSLLFKMQEKYFSKKDIPASLISDGTINVIAIIIALFFEDKSLVIIEEPERNIHPFLISRIVKLMKDASRNKQIIVTTHNPEMVKHADLEDLLLVSRNKKGFTEITRPAEDEEVKTFLKNDIGIDELHVLNLMGGE